MARDLIRRLLTSDRTKRLGNLQGGAGDVKDHRWFEGVDWDSVLRKDIGVSLRHELGVFFFTGEEGD